MLKSIAFIGYGFVGKACHKAFEHNAEAIIIDPKYSDTVISDLQISDPSVVFVCINAPTLDDRTVDASVIYGIFEQLIDIDYKGLVVLKSTLTPDIVHDLYIQYGKNDAMAKYSKLRYIYSPEFLKEATWEKDALNPKLMIMAGSFNDCTELQTIYERHSNIESYIRCFIVDYKVAALAKYAINSFLANKVVFMNQLYQLYSDMNGGKPVQPGEWDEFTDMITADIRMGHTHMQVPGNNDTFGYGGTCFPKDVKALIGFDKEGRLTVLRESELVNTQIRLAMKQ